jgi:hypothetical protein
LFFYYSLSFYNFFVYCSHKVLIFVCPWRENLILRHSKDKKNSFYVICCQMEDGTELDVTKI